MVDLCKVVSGLELSPQAEDAMISYSDDLVDALIDAICLETKERGAYRINESDVLNSVRTVSLFPARVVPRTTLKIFNATAKPDREVLPDPRPGAADNEQSLHRPGQPVVRPRKPVIDEARFLEDIRKMRPKDPHEPQTYYSHKLTLDSKDLRPRLGAAAIAEATAAMERPARHFIGRPQPLITEDRGCVQPELTTYNRYRNYLGINGPMPNIKPNVGPLTKIPAYLQALQQRNEMLGLASTGNTSRQVPAQTHPVSRPIQSGFRAPPHLTYQQPVPPQQRIMHPPSNFQLPQGPRQTFQQMHPHEAARVFHEYLQRQRREKWVDDLERAALMSPTPPLTECDYPLCALGDHYHCALSRKSADVTLSLTVQPTERNPESPACTRELTPPDANAWVPPEGPVDHVDCAEYYTRVNNGTKDSRENSRLAKSVENKEEQEKNRGGNLTGETAGTKKLVLPKPPSSFSAKEAELFEMCVKRLELIALSGHCDNA